MGFTAFAIVSLDDAKNRIEKYIDDRENAQRIDQTKGGSVQHTAGQILRFQVPHAIPAFFPIRTYSLQLFVEDLFFPTLVNFALKIDHIAQKIFAYFICITWDFITLPIRLITAIPRCIYNAIKVKKHPLRQFLEIEKSKLVALNVRPPIKRILPKDVQIEMSKRKEDSSSTQKRNAQIYEQLHQDINHVIQLLSQTQLVVHHWTSLANQQRKIDLYDLPPSIRSPNHSIFIRQQEQASNTKLSKMQSTDKIDQPMHTEEELEADTIHWDGYFKKKDQQEEIDDTAENQTPPDNSKECEQFAKCIIPVPPKKFKYADTCKMISDLMRFTFGYDLAVLK